jgi:hypothetical protein
VAMLIQNSVAFVTGANRSLCAADAPYLGAV